MNKISRLAVSDIKKIFSYYADHYCVPQARKCLRDVQDCIQLIILSPSAGQQRDDIMPGLRQYSCNTSTVYYRLLGKRIYIIRVIDDRMEDFLAAFSS